MITTTTDFVPGKEVIEILGIARGSTVRARNIGRDIFAGLKGIVGGEIDEYTKLQAYAREEAMHRMNQDALQMGADAIINVRLTTAMIMQGTAEILAYGTVLLSSNDKYTISSLYYLRRVNSLGDLCRKAVICGEKKGKEKK